MSIFAYSCKCFSIFYLKKKEKKRKKTELQKKSDNTTVISTHVHTKTPVRLPGNELRSSESRLQRRRSNSKVTDVGAGSVCTR